jgi:hypothetical protein
MKRKAKASSTLLHCGYAIYVIGWIAALAISAVLYFVLPWLVDAESGFIHFSLKWIGFSGPLLAYSLFCTLSGLRRTERVRMYAGGRFYPPNARQRIRQARGAIIRTAVLTGILGVAVIVGIVFASLMLSISADVRPNGDSVYIREWLSALPGFFLVFAILGAIMRIYRALTGKGE